MKKIFFLPLLLCFSNVLCADPLEINIDPDYRIGIGSDEVVYIIGEDHIYEVLGFSHSVHCDCDSNVWVK